MPETRQFNVRIPDEARDVLTRIATRLREDDKFAARLTAFMDTLDDPTADDSLAERVARIEARLDAMDAPKSGGNPDASLATLPVSTPTDTPQRDVLSQLATADTPALTTGEGRGRRLTTAGEVEVERRIEAGEDNATIARALDVSTNTVQKRRNDIAARLL